MTWFSLNPIKTHKRVFHFQLGVGYESSLSHIAQIYDVSQCFDSLWLQEVLNELYELGIDNDHMVLLYEENKKNFVAVKTSYGLTDKFEIEESVMQGTVFGPLK